MAPPENDTSLYYVFSAGIPLLVCVLVGRFVGWEWAAVIWLVGDMIYFVWKHPWREGWPWWRYILISLGGFVFGIAVVTGAALEKIFPKIVDL